MVRFSYSKQSDTLFDDDYSIVTSVNNSEEQSERGGEAR